MKLITPFVLALLLLTGFTTPKPFSNDEIKNRIVLSNQTPQIIVQGILVNGKVFPHVDLPQVTITAARKTSFLSPATIVDGHVVPHVQLNEVLIHFNK